MKKKINLFLLLIVSSIMYANVNTFKKIEILSKHPAKENLLNTANKYLNKEMDEKSISSLIDELSNKLKDEGYITSKLKLLKGNINSGDLYFEIESGKIGKIYFSDNKIPNRKIKTAFDIKQGSHFNIKDLDQGVENLNIGGKDYKLEIVDSNKKNYSDVIIHDNGLDYQKFINVSLDNSPEKFLQAKLDVSTEKYDLLNLNDTLKISANTKLGLNILRDFDTKLNLSYSIPKGYRTYKYTLGLGNSVKKEKGNNGKDINTVRVNINQKFDYSRIRFKDKDQKLIFNASLNVNKANTWIAGQKIGVQSLWDVFSTQSLSYTKKVENSSYGIKGTQEFGLNNFYFKYLLDANYEKNFILSNKNTLIYSMKSSLGFVFPKSVLDKKKIVVGDESTVRGFKNLSSTGEFGAYINNTLTYKMKNTNFSPFIGLDFGIVKDSALVDIDKLRGLSIGFNHRINGYNISATISKGIRFPLDRGSEKYAIYLSIGKRF